MRCEAVTNHSSRPYRLGWLLILLALQLQDLPAYADPLVELGTALFFDTTLSEPPGQACATCHDPARAFSDPRRTAAHGALSPGADGASLGDRNTPALTYVALIPPFARAEDEYRGGFFLDGRAATLNAQALEPMLNPLEMAIPDEAAIVSRVLGNAGYRQSLISLFGESVLTDDQAILEAISTALTAFEQSASFRTFDSKYDRHLAGTYEMTREEAIGRELFFSDLINCVQCHVNETGRVSARETFTDHRYHNIGVPVNLSARRENGLTAEHVDPGLGSHVDMATGKQRGKYRVPSLRNVAVTGPYMHNGVFQTLEAAVGFYGKYTLQNRPASINPETGRPWRPPEVPETVDLALLEDGQPIDEVRVRHLVAFLKTLTDQRFEHLLD